MRKSKLFDTNKYLDAIRVLTKDWGNTPEEVENLEILYKIVEEVHRFGYALIKDPDDAVRAEKIGLSVKWVTDEEEGDAFFECAIAR